MSFSPDFCTPDTLAWRDTPVDAGADDLLAAYESQRDILPEANFPAEYECHDDLEPLTWRYDAFFFDAFGVLNVGETAIDGAAQRVSEVRQAGRRVLIVSNAAGVPLDALCQRYRRLGFDFSRDEIVSSRVALIHYLQDQPARHWGIIAPAGADVSDLGVEAGNLLERPDLFDRVDGFILLSSTGWTGALQQRLLDSLAAHDRPVLLANPDLAAPREYGFSVEPGQIARTLRHHTACEPLAFGKPYRLIFDLALKRLPETVVPERVLMIGDTLHTDVLGGCSAGLCTALVTANGASASLDWREAIRSTGIVPHHVLNHI